ncbi:hypothetical protein C8F01DRAFT_1082502 [Mycena amicta]|nr:hypothetical protein C8F01DRAFT_1082502 [Mycena amicta]
MVDGTVVVLHLRYQVSDRARRHFVLPRPWEPLTSSESCIIVYSAVVEDDLLLHWVTQDSLFYLDPGTPLTSSEGRMAIDGAIRDSPKTNAIVTQTWRNSQNRHSPPPPPLSTDPAGDSTLSGRAFEVWADQLIEGANAIAATDIPST